MKILGNQGLEFPDGSIQSNAAYMPWRNKIINGAFSVDQYNNGAAVTPIGGTTYITDRWAFQSSIASKITLQRVAGRKAGQANAMKISVASSYVPVTTERAYFRQIIEGINVADLAWGSVNAQPITVSFDFECSISGAFSVALRNADNTRAYVTTFLYNTPNVQQRVSFSVAGCTDGIWDIGSGAGLSLAFDLGTGPDQSVKTATKNTWLSGGHTASADASIFVSAGAGAVMYLSDAQLEAGTKATPFERRFLADEEMRCRRYCRPMPNHVMMQAYAATAAYGFVELGIPMRTNPTPSTTAGFSVVLAGGGSAAATPTVGNLFGGSTLRIDAGNTSGLVAGNATALIAPAGALLLAEL